MSCLRNDMLHPTAHCAENAKLTSKRMSLRAIKAAQTSSPISARPFSGWPGVGAGPVTPRTDGV